MTRAAIVCSLFALGLVAPAATAQESASDYLPDAEAIGSGWTQLADLPAVDELDASFTDAAYGIYGGPDGARAVVNVFVVAEGMTAIRQSWEIGNSIFDSYRTEVDYGFQIRREDELADLPLPDGCSDARRLYAADSLGFQRFPVGLTLCAADPNVIVFVYASGEVLGETESAASDAIAGLVLTGGQSSADDSAAPDDDDSASADNADARAVETLIGGGGNNDEEGD